MFKFFNNIDREKSGYEYKMLHPFANRKTESTNILTKYPTKKPIIIEKYYLSPLQKIKKNKYLFPNDSQIIHILQTIRNHIKLNEAQGLYIYIGNSTLVPSLDSTIEYIYNRYADDDGFLYIRYCSENAFG